MQDLTKIPDVTDTLMKFQRQITTLIRHRPWAYLDQAGIAEAWQLSFDVDQWRFAYADEEKTQPSDVIGVFTAILTPNRRIVERRVKPRQPAIYFHPPETPVASFVEVHEHYPLADAPEFVFHRMISGCFWNVLGFEWALNELVREVTSVAKTTIQGHWQAPRNA
jgi:hypothetical protein